VPLALEAFSWLSHEAAQQFVEQISPTKTEYQVIVADGDETSSNLIRAGAYREASLRLREITEGKRAGSVAFKEPKDKAADYHNLGLAYETRKDWGASRVSSRERT
jgi:PleD family two-component response regulator